EALAELPDLDGATVATLEAAEQTVARLRTQVEASSAQVSLEALGRSRQLVVNGEVLEVAEGAAAELPVRGGLTIELPGDLRVRVQAEHGSAQLATDLDRAEELQAELFDQAGVTDLASAREVASARAAAAARLT